MLQIFSISFCRSFVVIRHRDCVALYSTNRLIHPEHLIGGPLSFKKITRFNGHGLLFWPFISVRSRRIYVRWLLESIGKKYSLGICSMNALDMIVISFANISSTYSIAWWNIIYSHVISPKPNLNPTCDPSPNPNPNCNHLPFQLTRQYSYEPHDASLPAEFVVAWVCLTVWKTQSESIEIPLRLQEMK